MKYRVFGLSLESSCPVRGLPRVTTDGPADVRVEFQSTAPWASSEPAAGERILSSSRNLDEAGLPTAVLSERLRDSVLVLRYPDGTQFEIQRDGRRVRASYPASMTLEDAAMYFLGPVLGRLLQLRGVPCLHAGAIVIDGGAIAVAGPAGAGKSTLTAALARSGHRVLTDDVTTLWPNGDEFLVHPGYRYIRLWPESALALFGRHVELPHLSPSWDKRYLDLDHAVHEPADPSPLGAVYFLEVDPDVEAPRIEPITGRDAFTRLLAESYVTTLLDAEQRAQHFSVLRNIHKRIPMRRLIRRDGCDSLERLTELLRQDVALLHSPAHAQPEMGRPLSCTA